MSLKKQIQEIINQNDKDDDVYDLVKYALRHFKRDQNRVKYDLQSNYNDVISNRHQLSESISIKGMKNEAIYRKLYRYETEGFKPDREDLTLSKKVCLALKCSRKALIGE